MLFLDIIFIYSYICKSNHEITMQALQTNSILQGGRYKVLSTLGQGGFGITYLAIQSGLERQVAIKEFFMKELCDRDESTSHVTLGTQSSRATVERFREKFLKEARNIAKLNHPNIVRIIDVFEENETAYYVMEYVANGSLADKVKQSGYLPETVATRYIVQIADALAYIHKQKMTHLDVKPANIMIGKEGEAVLIDFGLSKQYDASTGNQTSTTPVGISEGYAPMEQYRPGGVGEFSPQTDVYALGATYYKLLTGETPPNASDIMEDGLPIETLKAKNVSQVSINAITGAMQPRKRDRIADVVSFANMVRGGSGSNDNHNGDSFDDEATVLTDETIRAQAEAKAAKEKAEAERREKEAEAERQRKLEAEKAKAVSDAQWALEVSKMEARKKARKKRNIIMAVVFCLLTFVVVVGFIVLCVVAANDSSSYNDYDYSDTTYYDEDSYEYADTAVCEYDSVAYDYY